MTIINSFFTAIFTFAVLTISTRGHVFFCLFQFVGDCSVDRTFALLSRDNYSWEELKQRPLPDGVDPSRLEKYLSDDDFVVRIFLKYIDKS